jgi:heat shock protein HtpX
VKNRDTLTSTIAATIAGAISWIAYMAWWSLFLGGERRGGSLIFLPLVLLAPLAAGLVQLAISRTREFAADRSAGVLSKKPLGLASALAKISQFAKSHPLRGNSATSHLFIVNPFKGDMLSNMFSTHPPIEKRIEKLRELAKELKS